jgi:hypothetical protein
MPEYLAPEIANEGLHADAPISGSQAWMNSAPEAEEWQPPLEPPRVYDYAGFKTHKRWGKYFQPYR